MSSVDMNVPSLCIPRVFKNINEARIRKTITELNMGIIDKIDIIAKTTEKGDTYNRVFIHFKKWFTDGNAAIARERLLNGKEIKIIYDDPWFWKVSAYTARPSYKPKIQRPKAKFQFDDETEDVKQPSLLPNSIHQGTNKLRRDSYDDRLSSRIQEPKKVVLPSLVLPIEEEEEEEKDVEKDNKLFLETHPLYGNVTVRPKKRKPLKARKSSPHPLSKTVLVDIKVDNVEEEQDEPEK